MDINLVFLTCFRALTLIEDLKKGVVQQNKTIVSQEGKLIFYILLSAFCINIYFQNDLFTSPAAVRIPNPVVKCWTKEISNSKDGKANCRNIPCTFRSSDIDELKSHYTNCNLHPKRVSLSCNIDILKICSNKCS